MKRSMGVTILSALESAGAGAMGGRGAGFYFVQYGDRILVSLLLYRYLFRSNVREYFGLLDRPLRRHVLLDIGLCTAIAVAGILLGI